MGIAEFDISTGEVSERELTPEEQAELTERQAIAEAANIVEQNEQANALTIHDQLVTGLTNLDDHLAILSGTPTAAQQKAALIFTLQAIKKLARLQMRMFDSTD